MEKKRVKDFRIILMVLTTVVGSRTTNIMVESVKLD